MENQINESKNKGILSNKGLLTILIIEVLFYCYIYFFNDIVLSKVYDLDDVVHMRLPNIMEDMLAQDLAFLLLIAVIFELISFTRIPASPGHKVVIIYITAIPRLLLLWEISSILWTSFFQSMSNGAIWLMVLGVPLILLVVFVLFAKKEMFSKRDAKIPEPKQHSLSIYLMALPMYCIWYTLFEQKYLLDLYGGSLFIFIGLYSVFMYFPLKLPYIIAHIKSKSMSKLEILLLVIQPFVVYFMVYKSLAEMQM
jgi:hypothetical protein